MLRWEQADNTPLSFPRQVGHASVSRLFKFVSPSKFLHRRKKKQNKTHHHHSEVPAKYSIFHDIHVLSGPSNLRNTAHWDRELYVLGLYMHVHWMHLSKCSFTGLTLTCEAQYPTDDKSYPSRQKDLYSLSQIHSSVSFFLLKRVLTDTAKGLHRKRFPTLSGINLFSF